MEGEKIVAVALRSTSCSFDTILPLPATHADCAALYGGNMEGMIPGYVTDKGRFVYAQENAEC